ncbi:hypothetical protein GCM10023219_27380 [Stakelama sediminis]|uniref:Skp family chaperone for outer membrane proteins n=1 Tax=Stakelama sediminis TaxID=463200 RepID=A0A840YYH3_9SPHN|nr:OmpH family outer membrane protein [Stakelama sediminis]MBB5718580.1 Skp family chaperone for outer membrane proteins [Stakelama sediminis]
MSISKKLMLAAAAVAPMALSAAAIPAHAQVSGIATAEPTVAIADSNAFKTANQQIATTYKSNLDQARAKEQTRQTLLAQLDTNHDKQVDNAELQKAQQEKSPVLKQVQQIDDEINKLNDPAIKAQAYAIEQIAQKYQVAQDAVVAAKKVNVILSPDSLLYAPDSANITDDLTKQLNATVPSVSIAVPANWQPSRQIMNLQKQIQQIQQIAALRAAQQQQTTQPAKTSPAPKGR